MNLRLMLEAEALRKLARARFEELAELRKPGLDAGGGPADAQRGVRLDHRHADHRSDR
jgi:hypothetical protein